MKTGLNLLMDQPKQVGTDMVVDAVAAIHEYGAPVLIIDAQRIVKTVNDILGK